MLQRTDSEKSRYSNSFSVARVAVMAMVLLVLLTFGCQPVQPVDNDAASAESDASDAPDIVAVQAEITEDADATDEADATAVADPTATVSGQESDAQDAPPNEELVAAGLAVYREQYCGICHEFGRAETTGRFGPTHNGIGTTAASRLADPRYAGEAKTAEEYLYESLVDPSAYIVEGFVGTSHPMPPYTHLSEDDLRALVAMLMAEQ